MTEPRVELFAISDIPGVELEKSPAPRISTLPISVPLEVLRASPPSERSALAPELSPKESIVQPAVFGGCPQERTQSGTPVELENTQKRLDALIRAAGFDFVSSSIVNLSGQPQHGYTYACVIGESLIGIHTWPERGTVDINVHICGGEEKISPFLQSAAAFYGAASVALGSRSRLPI